MKSLLDNDAFGKRLMFALAEGHESEGFTEAQAGYLLSEIRQAELFLYMCRMAAQGELKIIVENGDVAFRTTEIGLEKISALASQS